MITEFTLKVRVRQDDITAGCHSAVGCAWNRAVVRAIKRRFRRWDIHNIGTSHSDTDIAQRLQITDDHAITRRYYRCEHPEEVRAWIAAFDLLNKVEPFETEVTFHLRTPRF